MSRMPALFIGHGSPMNTLELNGFTHAWRSLGRELPRPRALLVISAHLFIGATAAMARPRPIHDCYGFSPPKSLTGHASQKLLWPIGQEKSEALSPSRNRGPAPALEARSPGL